jgi:UDP-N-acetyl-2-amino-2-deoxyglucuronate dehydrogenase
MKNFALIGAAGYIAPRHMKAIKDTGNNLIAAFDPFDSVGIIDSYFPEADFFTEFERFDRHLEKLKRKGTPIDYVVICSPNYLHDAHIRFGLRLGAHVICEKPVVLNPWNVEALEELESEYSGNIYNVLQLRLHESVIALKERIDKGPKNEVYDIDLQYYTSRGKWYHHSWKGDVNKSGGIATNIGVHFFDMLMWIFGDVIENEVHEHGKSKASGFLRLQKARVNWILSVDYNNIPEHIRATGARTYRSITIGEEEFEFSGGFTKLHTRSYEDILSGGGFTIKETKKAIDIVHNIRNAKTLNPSNSNFSKLNNGKASPVLKNVEE